MTACYILHMISIGLIYCDFMPYKLRKSLTESKKKVSESKIAKHVLYYLFPLSPKKWPL